MATREQERAQRAYARVHACEDKPNEADYKRFCKRFPALIQSCGLAQAIAFAQAKAPPSYLEDLAHVVEKELTVEQLSKQAREAPLTLYQHHSRAALAAATWLKRYAEALLKGDET
jgi:CRISPR-associated protein Cmr5